MPEDTDDLEATNKHSVDVNGDFASSVCEVDIGQVLTKEIKDMTEGTVVENINWSLASYAFQPK